MQLSEDEEVLHQEACRLVELKRTLEVHEQEFILRNWRQSSATPNGAAGAFFTPISLARELALYISGDRIIDLGAGIGHLAWSCRTRWIRRNEGEPPRELVCIEQNPTYVAVGRKVIPEATWICADLFELPAMGLDRFDTAIATPPFGQVSRSGNGCRYTGHEFEYHVIDIAAEISRRGAFIVPQKSAPFRYSGEARYRDEREPECVRFETETGIMLRCNVGVDTTRFQTEWRGPNIRTELVSCEFPRRYRPAVPALSGHVLPDALSEQLGIFDA